MLRNRLVLFFIIFICAGTSNIYSKPMECKCHSKNPGMQRMHNMLGFKNCGNCHTKSENLMASKDEKGEKNIKAVEELKKRFVEDSFCLPCHKTDGTMKKEIFQKSGLTEITDSVFCPKDKKRFPENTKVCPKCGGNLLNVNKLIEESKKNPSNTICRQCHPGQEIETINAHITFKKEKLENCLLCHKGHDDCGGCHY